MFAIFSFRKTQGLPRSRGDRSRVIGFVALLIALAGLPACVAAQGFHAELDAILDAHEDPTAYTIKRESKPDPLDFDNVSEFKTLALAAIRFYQSTLSAQDIDVCNFHPSCSRFGAAIINEAGFLHGSLLTADRLTRCHGLPSMSNYYEREPIAGKFVDPTYRYVPRIIASASPGD